jgi:hypothetical protein
VLPLGEVRVEQPERGWHDHRRAHRLDRPRRNEHAHAGGQGSHDRGQREEAYPGQKDLLAAVEIGYAPGRDQDSGKDDRVRAEQPRQSGHIRSRERRADAVERDIDDEEVELSHERDGPEHPHDLPAAGIPGVGLGIGSCGRARRRDLERGISVEQRTGRAAIRAER